MSLTLCCRRYGSGAGPPHAVRVAQSQKREENQSQEAERAGRHPPGQQNTWYFVMAFKDVYKSGTAHHITKQNKKNGSKSQEQNSFAYLCWNCLPACCRCTLRGDIWQLVKKEEVDRRAFFASLLHGSSKVPSLLLLLLHLCWNVNWDCSQR